MQPDTTDTCSMRDRQSRPCVHPLGVATRARHGRGRAARGVRLWRPARGVRLVASLHNLAGYYQG